MCVSILTLVIDVLLGIVQVIVSYVSEKVQLETEAKEST
jgi:hypothetical protein